MRSLRKATIVFVAIFLLSLLSFVSAELNKRDPQAPGDAPAGKGAPPAEDNPPPPPPGKGAPPAEDNPPPPAGKGALPAGDNPPPPAGKGAPPAGDNPPPAAGKNAGKVAPVPPAGGNPPAAGKGPAAPGGNTATPGAPGSTTPTGNDTATPYVDPLTPTVQVKMIEPKLAKNILYKIGSNITFKWEYTDKFKTPPKSVSAYASLATDAKTLFPIALNMTLNNTQEATWVTANNASSLPMAKYKLWICDERGLVATANPGGLQVYSGLEFGLYQTQSNIDTCPTCSINNAISISIIPLLSTIGLSLITIISFNFISI